MLTVEQYYVLQIYFRYIEHIILQGLKKYIFFTNNNNNNRSLYYQIF